MKKFVAQTQYFQSPREHHFHSETWCLHGDAKYWLLGGGNTYTRLRFLFCTFKVEGMLCTSNGTQILLPGITGVINIQIHGFVTMCVLFCSCSCRKAAGKKKSSEHYVLWVTPGARLDPMTNPRVAVKVLTKQSQWKVTFLFINKLWLMMNSDCNIMFYTYVIHLWLISAHNATPDEFQNRKESQWDKLWSCWSITLQRKR